MSLHVTAFVVAMNSSAADVSAALKEFQRLKKREKTGSAGRTRTFDSVKRTKSSAETSCGVPVFDRELREELVRLSCNLKTDLRNELLAELRAELRRELRAELRAELQAELRTELRTDLADTLKSKFKALKAELAEEQQHRYYQQQSALSESLSELRLSALGADAAAEGDDDDASGALEANTEATTGNTTTAAAAAFAREMSSRQAKLDAALRHLRGDMSTACARIEELEDVAAKDREAHTKVLREAIERERRERREMYAQHEQLLLHTDEMKGAQQRAAREVSLLHEAHNVASTALGAWQREVEGKLKVSESRWDALEPRVVEVENQTGATAAALAQSAACAKADMLVSQQREEAARRQTMEQQQQLEKAQAAASAAREACTALTGTVEPMCDALNVARDELATQTAQLGEVHTKLSSLTQHLDTLQGSHDTAVAELRNAANATDVHKADVLEQLCALSQGAASVREDVASSVSKAAVAREQLWERMDVRAVALEQRLQTLSLEVAAANEAIDMTVGQRTNAVLREVEAITSRVTSLEEELRAARVREREQQQMAITTAASVKESALVEASMAVDKAVHSARIDFDAGREMAEARIIALESRLMGQLGMQRDTLAAAAASGETQKVTVASQQASLDALAAAVSESGMTTKTLTGRLGEVETRLSETETAVHFFADAIDGSRKEHKTMCGAQERLEETAEMLRVRVGKLEAEASTGSTSSLRDMLQRLSLQLQYRCNATQSSTDCQHGDNCSQASVIAHPRKIDVGGDKSRASPGCSSNSTASNIDDSSFEDRILGSLELNVGNGKRAVVEVRHGDDATQLACNCVNLHGLDQSALSSISGFIAEFMEQQLKLKRDDTDADSKPTEAFNGQNAN